ncbi:MAG: hypothetical protein JWQ81_5847 [Amycolatopsis sp.]|nr:hypothetical protein [Amycolatopsis sp.]MCU1685108.1 hypothetical protein [Amycolatopsis sp.]
MSRTSAAARGLAPAAMDTGVGVAALVVSMVFTQAVAVRRD